MDNSDLQTETEDRDETQFRFQQYAEFRFIGGQSNGATLKLAQGEYLIGNQDDCDVVFASGNAESAVFKITVSNDYKPSVSAVGGDISLFGGNGEVTALLGETPVELTSGSRVGIGTEYLVWHSNWEEYSNDWMLVSRSEIEALKNEAAEQNSEEKQEEALTENSSKTPDKKSEAEEKEKLPDEASKTGEGETEAEKQKSGKSHKRTLLTFAGLVILFMLYVAQNWSAFSGLFSGFSDEEKSTLEEYVKSSPKGKLFFRDKGKLYNITGVFRNIEDYQTFIDGLPDCRKPIELNIKLLSDVIDTIKRTFKMYGLSVNPVVADEHFDVFGYVIDAFVEADVLQKVKKDLLSYDFLKTRFVFRTEIEPFITDLCRQYNLDIELLYGRGFIAYKGLFSLSDLDKFSEVRRLTADKVGGDVDFRSYDSLSSEEKKELIEQEKPETPVLVVNNPPVKEIDPAHEKHPEPKDEKTASQPKKDFSIKNITGITRGPMNFITTKDGKTYFAGARLPGGYEIIKIDPEYVEVEKDGKREILYLK